MFTGIVERVGTVRRVEPDGETRRVEVEAGTDFVQGLQPGSSISVDGACLTATGLSEGTFTAEVIGTTLDRTVAGRYVPGTPVNLERAVPVGGRLEGHLVQGHVDGVGTLVDVQERDGFRTLQFQVPEAVHAESVPRGSIALNGISLTISDLQGRDRVFIGVVGHTWEHTNLHALAPGDPVNVEGDLLAKYVGKLLRRSWPEGRDAPQAGDREGGAPLPSPSDDA